MHAYNSMVRPNLQLTNVSIQLYDMVIGNSMEYYMSTQLGKI